MFNYFCTNHGDQVFFQFEIILNILVASFRSFEYKSMLWVYDGYKYFNSFSVQIVFIRICIYTSDSDI